MRNESRIPRLTLLIASIGLALAACAGRSPDTARTAPGPAPVPQVAQTCPPPLHACPPCNGGAVICASHCPDCPVLLAPQPEPAATLALASSATSCGGIPQTCH